MRERLRLWDYVKAAFNARVPVKGLGRVPVNWVALVGLGVATAVVGWPVLLVGGGVELGLLMGLAHNQRFRKVVEGEALLAAERDWLREQAQRIERLGPDARQRYGRLRGRCSELTAQATPNDPGAAVRAASVSRLQSIFLNLLVSGGALAERLRQSSYDKVQLELAAHERRLNDLGPDAPEALRRSVEGTIEILRRRRTNLEEAREKLRYIEAELARIEQQVELILEETALSRDTTDLSVRIDAVTQTLSDTQEWMKANADLFAPGGGDGEPPVRVPSGRVGG